MLHKRTFVRSTRLLTNWNPIPLLAPVTTKTALGSLFRLVASDSGLDETAKSISGKTGVPCVPGGSEGLNEVDSRRVVEYFVTGTSPRRLGAAAVTIKGAAPATIDLRHVLRTANAEQVLFISIPKLFMQIMGPRGQEAIDSAVHCHTVLQAYRHLSDSPFVRMVSSCVSQRRYETAESKIQILNLLLLIGTKMTRWGY